MKNSDTDELFTIEDGYIFPSLSSATDITDIITAWRIKDIKDFKEHSYLYFSANIREGCLLKYVRFYLPIFGLSFLMAMFFYFLFESAEGLFLGGLMGAILWYFYRQQPEVENYGDKKYIVISFGKYVSEHFTVNKDELRAIKEDLSHSTKPPTKCVFLDISYLQAWQVLQDRKLKYTKKIGNLYLFGCFAAVSLNSLILIFDFVAIDVFGSWDKSSFLDIMAVMVVGLFVASLYYRLRLDKYDPEAFLHVHEKETYANLREGAG